MVDELTLQAVSGITDPDQVRITLFINNQQVHAPLVDAVEVAASGAYLPLTGGTLTGALNGTSATFSGDVAANDGTFSGDLSAAAGTFTGLLTTNGQVAFPATQNPSANANTLDDYEEGTWTPTLAFGGASVGITYTTRQGRYQKVGNKVTIWGNITLSSKGSSVGNAAISGLPFNAGSTVSVYAGTVGFFGTTTTVVSMGCAVLSTSTSVTLYNLPSNVITNANINNTTQIAFHVEYEV